MRATRVTAALLGIAIAAGRPGAAQAPSDTVRLSLDDAVRRSLEVGEEMRSARSLVADARGQIREATAAAKRSCLGVLRPIQTMSGCLTATSASNAASSAGVSSRKGGV